MTPIEHLISPVERLQWSGQTDRGKVRRNNEDSFIGLQFDAREVHHLGKIGEASTGKTDFVFAVSDGMGGENAGELASRITVEKITQLLPRSFKQSAAGFETGVDDILRELFGEIHRALLFVGQSYEECRGMGATLSLCWFTPGRMHFGHIGDSRIYYLPVNGDIQQISHDDTHVGWLYRNAKINEREAREHPRRNVLQRALGAGNQFVEPQTGSVACEKGDVFLLCTDGLVDGLYNSHLAEHLRAAESAATDASSARMLVEEALKHAGRDNITAVVIRTL